MNGLYEAIRAKIYEEEDGMITPEAPEVEEKPEITPQLATELAEPLGVENIEQFQKGLQEELKHYDDVNKQLDVLAKIVCTNMGEFANYYDLIEHMKENLLKNQKRLQQVVKRKQKSQLLKLIMRK